MPLDQQIFAKCKIVKAVANRGHQPSAFPEFDELQDIVNHGMSAGVSGFIYTLECADKFDEHDDEIQDYLSDWCHDNGVGQSSFAYFAPDAEDIAQLKNKLVWAYVELKAQEILMSMEEE